VCVCVCVFLGVRIFLEVGVGESCSFSLSRFFFCNGLDLIEHDSINFQMYTRVSFTLFFFFGY